MQNIPWDVANNCYVDQFKEEKKTFKINNIKLKTNKKRTSIGVKTVFQLVATHVYQAMENTRKAQKIKMTKMANDEDGSKQFFLQKSAKNFRPKMFLFRSQKAKLNQI